MTTTRPRRATGSRISGAQAAVRLEPYALLIALGVVVLFFSVATNASGTFPTSANFQIVTGNQAVLALVALAAVIPLVTGQFDLSVGAVAGICSIACAAVASKHGFPLVPAIAVGIALGALIGLANGLLVAYLGLNSLITTLGTATILAGLTTWYTSGLAIVQGIPKPLTDLGTGNTLGIPRLALPVGVIAVLVHYVLEHTPLGRRLHAVGSSATAARLVGVRVDRMVLTSFVLAGVLAGCAGVLQVGRSGGANPQIGPNFTLPALAAAFLGAVAIKPGRYNVGGTLVAILLLAALTSGLTLAGTADYVNDLVNGGALILGVATATVLARRRRGD